MSSYLKRAALLALIAVCAVSVSRGEAQLGSLIKKAKGALAKPVIQAAAGAVTPAKPATDSTATPVAPPVSGPASAPAPPPRSGRVGKAGVPRAEPAPGSLGTLTAELLARFETGLRAEVEGRKAIIAAFGRTLSPADYQACSQKVWASPAVLKISNERTAAMEGAKDADILKATEVMNTKVQALLKSQCGNDPAGPISDEDSRRIAKTESDGAAAAGVKANEYGTIKERVLPFCRLQLSSKGISIDDASFSIPSGGSGNSYMYRAPEPAALKTACPTLLPLLAAML